VPGWRDRLFGSASQDAALGPLEDFFPLVPRNSRWNRNRGASPGSESVGIVLLGGGRFLRAHFSVLGRLCDRLRAWPMSHLLKKNTARSPWAPSNTTVLLAHHVSPTQEPRTTFFLKKTSHCSKNSRPPFFFPTSTRSPRHCRVSSPQNVTLLL